VRGGFEAQVAALRRSAGQGGTLIAFDHAVDSFNLPTSCVAAARSRAFRAQHIGPSHMAVASGSWVDCALRFSQKCW
jgi:hypothetical protein